ncbi:hypothetical protein MLD38_009351 [Melastoma candidum]|uniref:Uncharacterized protein n=1 Tax=Melastoma candidum TaxID=119954 RepID=A0ACB9RWE3_9MYRT|nr:hypothetical protein MLD38_009351 [Melastoma candidum]
MLENCELLGNQDTLSAIHQYDKSSRIEGNVDFIFSMLASVFENCRITIQQWQLKPKKDENNTVTAHRRTDPAMTTRFVFRNCLINGTDEYVALYRSKPQVHKNYLGRPWKEYSRTIFIGCVLESIIMPQGWMPWTGDFVLKTSVIWVPGLICRAE